MFCGTETTIGLAESNGSLRRVYD